MTVSVEVLREWICVSVVDQGRGIPQAKYAAIFDMFYQIDRKKFEDQGAGAGLNIVQNLVDLHDGKVEVSSTEGVGSTFKVFFPIHVPDDALH